MSLWKKGMQGPGDPTLKPGHAHISVGKRRRASEKQTVRMMSKLWWGHGVWSPAWVQFFFFSVQGIRVMCWSGFFPADFRACLLGPCSCTHFHCSPSYPSYPLSCIVQDILGSCGGKKPTKQYICQIWWVHEHECLLNYYLEVIYLLGLM